MASGDIRNQINGNDEKINQLKALRDQLSTVRDAVKKEERRYQYTSNQWAGNKEREITKDLGLGGEGMNAVRNQIAQDGTTVVTNVNDMIASLQSTNASLEVQYTTAKKAEDAEAARIAEEALKAQQKAQQASS